VGAHAVAVGVVEEAVEDGDGDGGVVEDVAPVDDVAVAGEDDRAVRCALLIRQRREGFADGAWRMAECRDVGAAI
jgi:hypothetical protein